MTENLFKLTDQQNKTRAGLSGETVWEIGLTVEVKPEKRRPALCTDGVVHACRNPNLALLLNPIQANIENPKLWVTTGQAVCSDYGKVGCYELTVTRQLSMPDWYADVDKHKDVSIRFAVLCAEVVLTIFEANYPNDDRPRRAIEAAKEYLKTNPGTSLSASAARAAYAAAYAAADAADAAYAATDYAAHAAAARAAYAAARAAYAAAHAAARAADAAYAAADAAAADAAYAATDAAHAAYAAHAAEIDFGTLADKAVQLVEKGESHE